MGADDYVAKPFSARELTARIESQLARARLRASEAAHRRYITAVFQHAPVGVAIISGPEHVFEFVNASYLTLLPHKRAEDLLGQSMRAALPELAGQGAIEILDTAYRTGEPYMGHAYRVGLARGERGAIEDRFFDLVYQPIHAANGDVEGIVIVAFDVTELARARSDAEAANRAKDDFMAMLGHELRNPLAPIVTAVELMALRGTAPRERLIIDRQVRHVMRLVDDLLDVSRIMRDKIKLTCERLDIAGVIADAVEAVSPMFEQQEHRLRTTVASGQWFVDGDRVRLGQVFSNLLTNAAKYTDARGEIEIDVGGSDSEVEVRVSDNGHGIVPELLPKLFDLFEQGARTIDRAQGGLGIGLAIVKNLVAQHGGSVSAASEGAARGSVFTVRLPRVEAIIADQRSVNVPAVTTSSGVRVLIVDDNQDAADMLNDWLRSIGHATCVVHDGADALEIAAEFKPTVALVDIGLPGMDGYEVAQGLRALFDRDVRLIAITGYGQESDRIRSERAGFDVHLVKPVELSKLELLLTDASKSTAL
jgi:signal transduction histidine kinase/ActR/RegA family two-component response regulator